MKSRGYSGLTETKRQIQNLGEILYVKLIAAKSNLGEMLYVKLITVKSNFWLKWYEERTILKNADLL